MLDRANTRRRRAQRPSGKTRRSVAQVPVCIEEEVQRRTAELRAALDLEHRRLREMGHRVKNNLQTLSALTLLKARRTEEEGARRALLGMAARIGALSTAYRLTDPTSDERVDASALLAEIAGDLVAAVEGEPIALALKLEPVTVSIEAAAPLALLLNELIGNALRHGLSNGRKGRLAVTARRVDDAAHLVVAADGVGPCQADGARDPFGQTLCEMLARQIKADLTFESGKLGTRAVVLLPSG